MWKRGQEQQKGMGSAEAGSGQRQFGFGPQIIRLIGELCGELKAKDHATCTALWAFQPHLSKQVIEGEAYEKIIHNAQEKKLTVQAIERIKDFILALYDQLQEDFFIQDDIIESHIIINMGLSRSKSPFISNLPNLKDEDLEWKEELNTFVPTGSVETPQSKKNTRESESSAPNLNPS